MNPGLGLKEAKNEIDKLDSEFDYPELRYPTLDEANYAVTALTAHGIRCDVHQLEQERQKDNDYTEQAAVLAISFARDFQWTQEEVRMLRTMLSRAFVSGVDPENVGTLLYQAEELVRKSNA